jgi:pilus assembly protein CpaE
MDLGRIIAVLAPSGGSGSSTIAVNLGTAIAMEHRQALLIDMILQAGDLTALLNIKPSHCLSDLCQSIGRMDESLFRSTLEHHASGVYLLAAPMHFSDIQYVTIEAIRQILTLAKAGFPYVIVDVDHNYRVEQTQVLRQADIILLVLRMDFNALRNAKRTMESFDDLGLDKAKIRLVINRFGQANEVPASQAEEALGIKIFEYIPDDPWTVNRANNNGEPLVVGAPTSRIARSIVHLAKSIEGKDLVIDKPKSSIWGNFF